MQYGVVKSQKCVAALILKVRSFHESALPRRYRRTFLDPHVWILGTGFNNLFHAHLAQMAIVRKLSRFGVHFHFVYLFPLVDLVTSDWL